MNVALRAAQREFDVMASAIVRKARAEGHQVPCAPRCDACCYDVAWCLNVEADELVERVRSMPGARRAQVLARLERWLEAMASAGLDPRGKRPDLRTYHRLHVPCPLLDQERHGCMVYELRPLSCRAHYVIGPDSRRCANRAEEPNVMTIVFDEHMVDAVTRMVGGDGERLRALRETLFSTALAERLCRDKLEAACTRAAEVAAAAQGRLNAPASVVSRAAPGSSRG